MQQRIERRTSLEKLSKREENKQHNQLPELQPMETVCLFADISGFTNLSEKCANMGVRGNEELAFCINRYMEGMVKNLGKYGGDIIKFVGDAMIVMWPPTDEDPSTQKQDVIRKAIQCALDIQREMGNLVILEGVSSLSVKIGIGYGKCALLYVGGVFNRAEFFTVGEALKLALKSEGNATGGGQIIVAEQAYSCVKENYSAEEIINDKGEKFYLIGKLIGQGVKTRADAQLLRSQFKAEFFTQIQAQLRFWVPAAIIPYLQIGAESFGSETRSLTVMFLNLGVDLSSAETNQGMQKIQKIVTTVQQQIYRLEGSVNKLVMDDKGSTFICLWGVCPLSHEDDAARAILTGFNIQRELEKIDNTKCKIGISSGEVFSGVVGTTGSRKEFSVLGDVVNLAARIMGSLKYSKENMCVDMNTRNLASNFFHFNYLAHKEFKGKSISIPIFEPVDPQQMQSNAIEQNKALPPDAMLFIHSNPLIVDRTNDQKKRVKTIGFDQIMYDLTERLLDFIRRDDSDQPFLAVIKGEVGSGKTTFALNLVEEIQSSRDFRILQGQQGKSPIFSSTLNAETELQFLNIWRPVLQMMLINVCKRQNIKKEKLLKLLLSYGGEEQANCKKLDVICSILGIKKEQIMDKLPKAMVSAPQIKPKPTPFPFVSKPDYEERAEIIEMLLVLIKMAIGETEDISLLNQTKKTSTSKSKTQDSSEEEEQQPFTIIILDNAHMMDAASWQMFEAVNDDCNRVAIILLMQTDEADKPKIPSDVKSVFESIWLSPQMEDLIQIDLPFFDEKQLDQLLITCGLRYQSSYMDEIDKMTEIVDKENTIKTEQMAIEWKKRLIEKWQLQTRFKAINPEVLKVIVRKCSGNPLICLVFFQNMLHNGLIEADFLGSIEPTNLFINCQRLSDWKSVPVPRLALKTNCQRIDKFIQFVQNNPRKKPGDLEACITSVVILKAAVVLGQEFEFRALKKVQPLSRLGSEKMLLSSLKLLEQYELIEILDETDSKNIICRFSINFLRESLYQILLFRECKQQLHTAAADYLQNSVPSICQDPEIEAERLKQHMLKAQDITNENQLSYQSKTGLIVRRIQNLIIRDSRQLIMQDTIYKEARSHGKISLRLCSLSAKHFRWYHDKSELQNGVFMGSLPLVNITSCVASFTKQQNKFAFSVASTLQIDRNLNEVLNQTVDFCCDDIQNRDKWVISIEFLRTRAVYEDYASKNIPVQFPLRTAEEEAKGDESDGNDNHNLLYDFASTLKGKTMQQFVQPNQVNIGALFAHSSKSDSILSKKNSVRASILRTNEDRSNHLTAAELIPKLKFLYNSGMVSFMHHIQQNTCKMTVKQQQAKLGQLPDRAIFEMGKSVDQLLSNNDVSKQLSSNSFDVKKLFSDEKKNERIFAEKRRNSSVSDKTGKVKIQNIKDQLIMEVDSESSSQKDNHKLRRSQEVNENNIMQLQLIKDNDDDISNQIKKVNQKAVSSSLDSELNLPQFHDPSSTQKILSPKKFNLTKSDQKPKSNKTTPANSKTQSESSKEKNYQEQRENKQTFAAQERPVLFFGNKEQKQQTIEKMKRKSSPLARTGFNNVDESTIKQDINNSGNFQDLSSFSDMQTSKNIEMGRLQTGQFGEEQPAIGFSKNDPQKQTSTFKEPKEESIMSSIQQLLSSSLGKGLSDIMSQNQKLIETQQRQINQQMQLLNQSMTQNQMLMQQSINNNLMRNFHGSPETPVMHGMGITSKSKKYLEYTAETPRKQTTEIDDDEPEDPDEPSVSRQNIHDSITQSEIKQLYEVYPQIKQQLDEPPTKIKSMQRTPTKTQQQVQVSSFLPRKEEFTPKQQQRTIQPSPQTQNPLLTSSAKYMQRLYKKQLQQDQVKQSPQQDSTQQFYPLPESMWEKNLEGHSENARYAKAIRKTQCQLVGDMMEIPAGAKVRIVEKVAQIQMYRIKYGKRVGLFLMRDFKPIAETIQNVPIFAESSVNYSQKQPTLAVDESPKSIDSKISIKPERDLKQAPSQALSQGVEQRKNFFKEKGKFDFLY